MQAGAQFNGITVADVQNRLNAQLIDAHRRHRFQPDGLPDTGRTVVVAAFRNAADSLFAARLIGVLLILGAHDQAVEALPQIWRDVEGEGHVPTLIMSYLMAVEPYRRLIIYCAEVEQNVL